MYNFELTSDHDIIDGTHFFFKGDDDKFKAYIYENIKSGLYANSEEVFTSCTCKPAHKLFYTLKENKTFITSRVSNFMGGRYQPSTFQLKIIEAVTNSLLSNEQRVFLVSVGPGSGKTLIAFHLLLGVSAINNNFGSVLSYRNNRFAACLRELLDQASPGLGGALVKYNKYFLEESTHNNQLVIFDETQRMTKANIKRGYE